MYDEHKLQTRIWSGSFIFGLKGAMITHNTSGLDNMEVEIFLIILILLQSKLFIKEQNNRYI
jgi:hypothetical protein